MKILHKEYRGDSVYLRILNEPLLDGEMVTFFHTLGFPDDELDTVDNAYGDFDEVDFEIDSTKYQAFLLVTKRYVHVFIVIKTGLKNEIEHLVREVMTNPSWGQPQ